MLSRWLTTLRKRLWHRNPQCEQCGRRTMLPRSLLRLTGAEADHMATIEHVYSRLHPLRDQKRQIYRLLCARCNRDNNEMDKRLYVTNLWTGEQQRDFDSIPSVSYRMR